MFSKWLEEEKCNFDVVNLKYILILASRQQCEVGTLDVLELKKNL
jgi:hypothetical protein